MLRQAAPPKQTRPRQRVTATFLLKPGGYFAVDGGLFRILAVPEDSNERLVPVEDCLLPIYECAVRMDRSDIRRGEIVRWPPELA